MRSYALHSVQLLFPLDERDYLGAINFTTCFNMLNLPCGVTPVREVTAEDVENTRDYPRQGFFDRWAEAVKKGMQGSQGLPVGVQVAALPWHDEKCLRVMQAIENGVRANQLKMTQGHDQ